MASNPETVTTILDLLAAGGVEADARKMFGEYGLYVDGRMVALVCDDRLFVKATPGGRALLGEVEEAPPYPGAKPLPVIEGDRWDDADWLAEVFRVTAVETPMPKPKNKSHST